MRHGSNAFRLTAFAALLAFGSVLPAVAANRADVASDQQKPVTRSAPPSEWEVGVATSGGFTGSGKGTISLRSDGAVTPRFQCRLDRERFADVERAVASAQPERWRQPGPAQSLIKDQFHYSLFLRTRSDGGRERSVRIAWRDQNYFDLPADLRNLYEALWAAHEQMRSGCNAAP